MIQFLSFFLFITFSLGQSWSTNHLVNGCRVFDFQGKIVRDFPGRLCVFLSDCRFASYDNQKLTFFGTNSEKLWQIEGYFHHQLNLSPDGESILAMGSELVDLEGKQVRSDVLMVINLKGEVVHKTTALELWKQVKLKARLRNSNQEMLQLSKVENELSHFNSFYEVPLARQKSYGKYIVNSREDGVLLISSDLKKVLGFFKIPQSFDHQVHDAQILPNGHLLVFNNVNRKTSGMDFSSSILELDVKTLKKKFEISATPKSFFFSPTGSSVQKLDNDHYLISHLLMGSMIYSKIKKDFIEIILGTHLLDGVPTPTQQVKAIDLKQFLSHWK